MALLMSGAGGEIDNFSREQTKRSSGSGGESCVLVEKGVLN